MDKPVFPTADTEKMMRLPVGALSPLWLMFAGAATVGAAYFWSRTFFKPTNLEALTALPEAAGETVVETVEPVLEAATETVETVVEAAPEVVEAVEAAAEPVVEAAVETAIETTPAVADDLTVLTGIGPKLAAAFAERGVTTFAQIAAWTEDDVARFDKELKLMGRVGREAWIAQAARLATR